MIPRSVRRGAVALASGLAFALAAQPASASPTAFVHLLIPAGVLAYDGGADENDVVITFDGTVYTVTDAAGLTVGEGCTSLSATEAHCYGAIVPKMNVVGGAGDDQIRVGLSVTVPTITEGDAGADIVIGGNGPDAIYANCGIGVECGSAAGDSLQGRGGNDHLFGDVGDDTMDGGSGDDDLQGWIGHDLLAGGSGKDLLQGAAGPDTFEGGDGSDTADYGYSTHDEFISLDGLANDGVPGEKDNVKPDVERVVTGSGNDVLVGSDGANVLKAGLGNDTLDDRGGDDFALGQDGDDDFVAGTGKDVFFGGLGKDQVSYEKRAAPVYVTLDAVGNDGQAGEHDNAWNDVEDVRGGAAADLLVGSSGKNFLNGMGGPDIIDGGGEADTILGLTGSDLLLGGDGADVLIGGEHEDVLVGGAGADAMHGLSGGDTADYSARTAPVTVSLDGVANDGEVGEGDQVMPDIENLVGGGAGDTLSGNDAPNRLSGLGGADNLVGLPGNDTLVGGPAADDMKGGVGDDRADYSTAPAAVNVDLAAGTATGDGADTLTAIEDVTGSAYADTLKGNTLANVLAGGDGADTLMGRAEGDFLSGKEGADVLAGGPGNDTLFGEAGADTADFSASAAGVTVDLTALSATGQGTDTLVGIENVTGSDLADSITGSAVANVLLGLGGADFLSGLAGSDTLDGGNGVDTLDGGADPDVCQNGETLIDC